MDYFSMWIISSIIVVGVIVVVGLQSGSNEE